MQGIKKKLIIGCIIFVVPFLVTLFLLFWNGVVLLNNPSTTEYPVRGVDVSSYQGEIDWQVLSSQQISFVFIKATEGSTKNRFENWHISFFQF